MYSFIQRGFLCAFILQCKHLGVLDCFEVHVFKLSDFNGGQNWNVSEGEQSSLQVLAAGDAWGFVFLGMGKVLGLGAALQPA